MNEKRFVIKVGNWRVGWIKDTEENVRKFLDEVGCTSYHVEKLDTPEEDMGYEFDYKFQTELDVIGYDKDLADEIKSKMRELLSKYRDNVNVIDSYEFNTWVDDTCGQRTIATDKLQVLICDKDVEDEKGERTYTTIKDFTRGKIWMAFYVYYGYRRIV